MKSTSRFICFMILFMTMGCQTLPRITHESPKDDSYVSGRWNDSDARKVAEEMIYDCLDRAWLLNFIKKHGENPTVIVGQIKNQTSEHIDINTFIGSIQRALINSGKVSFVASQGERKEVRDERKDQATNSREDTQKGPGEEIGADYILKGIITSIRDQSGGTSLMYYQVNLKLISMADNQIVWVGEKKIRRKIERSRWSL
ncbi:MAG: penicillin-binding protein activator LpoB [Candidatus Magnetomorum sp.]|nr:penicillin-binding protein activator LpoB [Candidatus Magnetomorum sp.]